jgi:hypothetical protein
MIEEECKKERCPRGLASMYITGSEKAINYTRFAIAKSFHSGVINGTSFALRRRYDASALIILNVPTAGVNTSWLGLK